MTGAGGRRATLLLAALLPVALGACRDRATPQAATPQATAGPGQRTAVVLHFPGNDGLLHVERREITLPAGEAARLRAIVAALLAGPQQEGLLAPFPPGVESAGVLLDPHGIAYVDLVAKEMADPPPSGSALEMVRVYSVVNTVLANEERARSVVLLWNGKQRQTFAGHLDTLRPLRANRQLVR